jgi:hypothetical protein
MYSTLISLCSFSSSSSSFRVPFPSSSSPRIALDLQLVKFHVGQQIVSVPGARFREFNKYSFHTNFRMDKMNRRFRLVFSSSFAVCM